MFEKTVTYAFEDFLASGTEYFIPAYQRGYAWGEKEVNDLIEDIANLKELGRNRSHFMGIILARNVNGRIEIADGQQRFTTLLFMIAAFDRRMHDNHLKRVRFSFEQDGEDKKTFGKIMRGETGKRAETAYQKNMLEASETIDSWLNTLREGERKEYLDLILKRLRFGLFVTDDSEMDIQLAFETINNRGRPLSNLELLKNRLFYIASYSSDPNVLESRINEAFSEIYGFLGYGKARDDNAFLRAHWIIYRHLKKNKRDFYVDELFGSESGFGVGVTLKADEGTRERKIEEYLDSLKSYARAWALVSYPFNGRLYQDYKDELKKQEWEELRRFYVLAPSFYVKTALVYVCHSGLADEEKLEIYKSLERIYFVKVRLLGEKESFSDFASPLSSKEKGMNELRGKIAAREKEIDDLLSDPDATRHLQEKIREHLTNIKSKEIDFYAWDGIRFVLYAYDKKSGGLGLDIDSSIFACGDPTISIEHILPQDASDDYWKTAFPDPRPYLNSIGNLLPLTKQQNTSLSNKPFGEKAHGDGKYSYKRGLDSVRMVADENDEWTPSAVYNRGKELLRFIKETWLDHGKCKPSWDLGFLNCPDISQDEDRKIKQSLKDLENCHVEIDKAMFEPESAFDGFVAYLGHGYRKGKKNTGQENVVVNKDERRLMFKWTDDGQGKKKRTLSYWWDSDKFYLDGNDDGITRLDLSKEAGKPKEIFEKIRSFAAGKSGAAEK